MELMRTETRNDGDAMMPIAPGRVAIAGMGLIGGSLARRLVERGCEVAAWNHRPAPYERARREGIVCVDDIVGLVDFHPDVLVLCTPLKAMGDVLGALAAAWDPDIVLTDVGSVKGQVRDDVVAAGLGRWYVGGHPMAGNERSGYQASDPRLYDGALWAVTVDGSTSYDRLLTMVRFVTECVGNRCIVLDDGTHDRAAAMISHMPHVVATALANELSDSPDRNIEQALAAGSWRDMTRVALTDPNRTRAMVEEDAANVAELLHHMARRLEDAAHALERRPGDEVRNRELDALFSHADPYRRFKASRIDSFPQRTLTVTPDAWRDELLASARRGEHITACESGTTFRVELRTAL